MGRCNARSEREMSNMKYPQTDEELRIGTQKCYEIIGKAFSDLAKLGYPPVFVNACAMGMCRKSQGELLGVKKAMKWDKEARKKIGWK